MSKQKKLKIDELAPLNPKEQSSLAPIGGEKKKVSRKRKLVAYTLPEETIELVRRAAYWEREYENNMSALVEDAIHAFLEGKEYEPKPEKKKRR